jgi:EmrB/QacA subfamily drug resistance transporter
MGTAGGRGYSRTLLWSMTLANAMILVDQTAVPLALPAILKSFSIGSQQVQWVMNGSLLPLAGLLVLGGRLGDLFGRRRVFILGTVVFAGASAVGGFAPVFPVLLACRVLQGTGGALMLPNTVAIVSASVPDKDRGEALGMMGGAAAVAGAFGPTIGGALTALSWRAVLLVNVPLAVLAVAGTLRAVPPDAAVGQRPHLDIKGTVLLTVALVGLVFGLSQSQVWGWASPGVVAPLIISVCAAAVFVRVEYDSPNPLMNLPLLWRHPNYLGTTISQFIAGIAEMGLALLFPLLLVLNLQMSPTLAGLALIPTTLPMVLVAPLAGRWYDRAGGRPPLITGFAILLASTLLLAWSVHSAAYLPLLPGLLLYGVGLSLVLTANDPVSLDTVPVSDHGQASGVSATAEQFGGAVGIAGLYLIFHASYLSELQSKIASSPLPHMTPQQAAQFKNSLIAAESTGLRVNSFGSSIAHYLLPARAASEDGYSLAFITVSVLCLVALVVMIRLIRKPPRQPDLSESAAIDGDAQPGRSFDLASHDGDQEVTGDRG